MIKLTINKGHCDIKEISGNGIDIMSELCVIVKAVCTAFTEDEKEREKLCSNMILMVSNALKNVEGRNWCEDLEDDENADFQSAVHIILAVPHVRRIHCKSHHC